MRWDKTRSPRHLSTDVDGHAFVLAPVRVAGGPVGANDTDQSRLRQGRTNELPHKTARASGNGRFFRDSTSAGQDRRTALMGLFPEIARDAMLHGVFREFRDGANAQLLHNSSLMKLRRLDGNAQ